MRHDPELIQHILITPGLTLNLSKSGGSFFDFDENHTCFLCCLPVHPQAAMPEGSEGANLSDSSDLSDTTEHGPNP